MAKAVMMKMLHTIRAPSASIRPLITADRAMGRDRNRSMTPRWKSTFRAMAVVNGRNATLCTRIPGRANWRYSLAGHDGSSEHEHEQRQEHDGLDGHLDQLFRRGLDVQEVAPGDGQRVGDHTEGFGAERVTVAVLMLGSFRESSVGVSSSASGR